MNERILVTGASRGIGRAVALSLAQDGYDIVVCYGSRSDEAQTCVQAIEDAGGRGKTLQLDISDREACRNRLSEDINAHGAYYGVILNAGISDDQAFPAMSEAAWDNVLRTNLDGFYNVLQPCVMPMVRRRKPGRIVVMTSISGIIGNRGQSNYGASKAGLIGAAKSLAVELAKRQITVNCVAPGLIDTDMAQEAPVEMITNMIPLRRLGKPEEVADLVRYLCSPLAGYITRQVIRIDGGMAG